MSYTNTIRAFRDNATQKIVNAIENFDLTTPFVDFSVTSEYGHHLHATIAVEHAARFITIARCPDGSRWLGVAYTTLGEDADTVIDMKELADGPQIGEYHPSNDLSEGTYHEWSLPSTILERYFDSSKDLIVDPTLSGPYGEEEVNQWLVGSYARVFADRSACYFWPLREQVESRALSFMLSADGALLRQLKDAVTNYDPCLPTTYVIHALIQRAVLDARLDASCMEYTWQQLVTAIDPSKHSQFTVNRLGRYVTADALGRFALAALDVADGWYRQD